MKALYSIFIFILGLIMGSFYNVVGLRLPKKQSLITPRSHCPECNHQLKWYENIPVLSYLFLKGKCKNCKEPISLMYPLIELLTGIMFLLNYLLFDFTEPFYISLVISSLLSIIFVSDTKYYIIDDEPLIASAILIIIIRYIFEGPSCILNIIVGGTSAFLFAYSLRIFGFIVFKQEALGGGDIKLSFVAGMFLGIKFGILYIVLASFLAFPYAIYITIKNKDNMLPFGPFLVSSLLIVFLNMNMFNEMLKMLF